MPFNTIQQNSIIPNEPGILRKGSGGFHTPSPFISENLGYVLWNDEYLCSKKYNLKRNYLESYLLLYVVSGKLILEYDDREYTLENDTLAILDLRQPHRYYTVSTTQVKQFMIDGPLVRVYYNHLYPQYGPVYRASGNLPLIIENLQKELSQPLPDEHRTAYLLHQILGKLSISKQPLHSPAVLQSLNFIKSHYMYPITLDEIAKAANLSKYHFSREFRHETGYAPHEYLADYRIRSAKQFLTETHQSVEQIGNSCGYMSATHFIRAFKKACGITPAQFRKQFQLFG